MSGGAGRFEKGQSGNPAGRPKARRPHNSAFDIIFDKTLTVTQGEVERELTVDEGLQLQTYQAALKGSKMAVRAVLKMIEKRERWIAAKSPPKRVPIEVKSSHEGRTADDALLLLGIAVEIDFPLMWPNKTDPLLKLRPWVVEEGFRRSRRRKISEEDMADIRRQTFNPERPDW